MRRLLLAGVSALIPALAFAQSAGSTVNNLPTSPAIVGTQVTYCPLGSTYDYKCTFSQIAAFVSANLAAGSAAANLGATLGTSGATIPLNSTNNTESGLWTFSLPPVTSALPGLSASVYTLGTPGLDLVGCTTAATCGWAIFSIPSSYPAAGTPTLRVEKSAPATGGIPGSVYNTLQVNLTTGLNDEGYQWANSTVVHNRTLYSAGAQQTAVNGTCFKELNGQPAGTNLAYCAAGYFQSVDDTGDVSPTTSPNIGAEIDAYRLPTAGADANVQTIVLSLNDGPSTPTPSPTLHTGRMIAMNSGNSSITDIGISAVGTYGEFLDLTGATFSGNVFNLTGFTVDNVGNTTIGGQLQLSNATSPHLFFGANGLGAPGSGSTGQKIQLFGTSGVVGATDYGIGVVSGQLWFTSGGGYQFYNGVTLAAAISSAGVFSSGASSGVSCSGAPTGAFATVGGIVIHC